MCKGWSDTRAAYSIVEESVMLQSNDCGWRELMPCYSDADRWFNI